MVNKDLGDIAEEMLDVAWAGERTGLDMHEYDSYDFDPAFRERVRLAMLHWESGTCDLFRAAKEMAAIAKEMPGGDDGGA